MVAINALKPGDTVWDVSNVTAGNTALKRQCVRPVHIVSVDAERGTVLARWNGNSERTYRSRDISRWKRNKPAVKVSAFDRALVGMKGSTS